MTTMHTHGTTHRSATLAGTVLVAIPLAAGVGAGLMTLTGRFGGPGNAFTALWYVAAAAAPVALAGAVVLLAAQWNGGHLRTLALWSALAAAGWVFGLGSAQLTGLADGSSTGTLDYALLGIGVGVYVVGLVGLVLAGRRAAGPAA